MVRASAGTGPVFGSRSVPSVVARSTVSTRGCVSGCCFRWGLMAWANRTWGWGRGDGHGGDRPFPDPKEFDWQCITNEGAA